MRISQRSRALDSPASDAQNIPFASLRYDADALLPRRCALFAAMQPDGAGGYYLDEERLEQLVGEARVISREVRTLWQRARACVAAHRPVAT